MFTGFGKHKKNLLSYLYKTGKYEIIELSNGYTWSNETIKNVPWESYGSLPDDPEAQSQIASDEARKNLAHYGSEMIDHAIVTLKPDIYLGIEDIWAFQGFYDKPWWNKLHCIVHTTLDSLPILQQAIDAAPKINHYFVWSSFAEKALKNIGHNHVRTIRGIVEAKNFFKIDSQKRTQLRKRFNIENDFVVGFVFRNQLRKSVPNLLDGFKAFHQKNQNCKLLLHTHWSEGWDIPKLLIEKNIDFNCVLTTYFCKNCSQYLVKPFTGQNIKCEFCKHPNSTETTNIKHGVSEEQLNEIYNLMDVYCHPFTSGGQEIPIQEAKLTELITLVTNYSCGEDTCTEESGGLPLSWAEYREPGTQFIKASTYPSSICAQLERVYSMTDSERSEFGKRARKFVIDNFSTEVVGKMFENLFDSLPQINFSYQEANIECDAFYEPNESLNDRDWVESLYTNILKRPDPAGREHWIMRLRSDLKRQDVITHFRKVAIFENQNLYVKKAMNEIAQSKNEKRIAFVQPDSVEEVIICCSLLPSVKKQYPDHDIYFFTKNEHFEIVNSNPYVYKVLPFFNKLNDPLYLEGKGDNKKYFDIVYAPYLSVRNNFIRNSQDVIQYNIYEHN